jgi:hypothetical protein
LQHEAKRANLKTLLLLLNHGGADVNHADEESVRMARLVVGDSYVRGRRLPAWNSPPPIQTTQERTALHYAAAVGSVEVAAELLARNADPNLQDSVRASIDRPLGELRAATVCFSARGSPTNSPLSPTRRKGTPRCTLLLLMAKWRLRSC